MNKDDIHRHINNKAPHCEHNFIATNTKKTDKHEAVTQMVCQRCLLLVNFEDVASGCEKYQNRDRDPALLPEGAFLAPAGSKFLPPDNS